MGPPALPPPPAPRLRCVLTKAQQEDPEAGRPRDSVSQLALSSVRKAGQQAGSCKGNAGGGRATWGSAEAA